MRCYRKLAETPENFPTFMEKLIENYQTSEVDPTPEADDKCNINHRPQTLATAQNPGRI